MGKFVKEKAFVFFHPGKGAVSGSCCGFVVPMMGSLERMRLIHRDAFMIAGRSLMWRRSISCKFPPVDGDEEPMKNQARSAT